MEANYFTILYWFVHDFLSCLMVSRLRSFTRWRPRVPVHARLPPVVPAPSLAPLCGLSLAGLPSVQCGWSRKDSICLVSIEGYLHWFIFNFQSFLDLNHHAGRKLLSNCKLCMVNLSTTITSIYLKQRSCREALISDPHPWPFVCTC